MRNHRKYLEKQKDLYNKIGVVHCSVLGGEAVYFNNRGYNHLLRKLGKLRDRKEQVERLKLIRFVKVVIEDKNVELSMRIDEKKNGAATFWSLTTSIGSNRVKVVLRKIKDGKIHFFSIFLIK